MQLVANGVQPLGALWMCLTVDVQGELLGVVLRDVVGGVDHGGRLSQQARCSQRKMGRGFLVGISEGEFAQHGVVIRKILDLHDITAGRIGRGICLSGNGDLKGLMIAIHHRLQ
mgnify:CR=1 FL=1